MRVFITLAAVAIGCMAGIAIHVGVVGSDGWKAFGVILFALALSLGALSAYIDGD